MVVTTLETAPSHEARFLAEELRRRRMSLGAIIANRALPGEFAAPAAARSAAALGDAVADGTLVADVAAVLGAPPDEVGPVLGELADRFDEVALGAAREVDRATELAPLLDGSGGGLITVPWLDDDVHGIDGLVASSHHLTP